MSKSEGEELPRCDFRGNASENVAEFAGSTYSVCLDHHWASLKAEEIARLAGLVVERVDYNGATGKVAIAFRPEGIRQLVQEWILPAKEKNR